ncbi:CHAT domain-containing protein [Lactarius sanguifluus]|nr:CHAT domain-containing protein [Lactarius sanguifluus]
MRVLYRRCKKLCFLHQLYSYNMPLSSRRPTILVVCRWTMLRIWSTRVSSRKRSRPLKKGEPHSSLPTVGGEIQVVQSLDTEVTSLISEATTPAAVADGFRHHQFVHFACHGTLEPGKPFEAGFELYGGERLTLLEIVRSELPTAEFAFLSVCHTAEIIEGSIVDEGLHLVVAVQYCGFRSVVGTMWAMADVDGRDLAKHFYRALFSTRKESRGYGIMRDLKSAPTCGKEAAEEVTDDAGDICECSSSQHSSLVFSLRIA